MNTTGKYDGQNEPTWKAMQGNQNTAFYEQCFDMNDPRGPNAKKRYEPDGGGRSNNNYKPAFDLPGSGGDRKGPHDNGYNSKAIDAQYKMM